MICITGGRVIDPDSGLDQITDLLIEDGRIVRIGPGGLPGDCHIIDARGLVVSPGLVDTHVHFRDPGYTEKECLETGARSAAAGGYTSVVCMANTRPPVDDPAVLRDILGRAARLPVHVYSAACVTLGMKGKALCDLPALAAAGAVGFSDDGMPIEAPAVLLEGLREAHALGLPVSLHEEDPSLMGSRGVNAGIVASRLGLPGAPSETEAALTARDCALALTTGARVIIQHVSAAQTISILRAMKAAGAPVFAEVTPHHLSLTEEDVLRQGTLCKVNPPLRTEADRQALIAGVKDGTIDVIATDHAPHTLKEKDVPAGHFSEAPSGMIGLETALALCITHLVRPGHLTLPVLLARMTCRPADLFGLPAGRLCEGGPADIVIFDPEEAWTVPPVFESRSANSPFVGCTLYGRVHYTFSAGRQVWPLAKED